MILRWLLPLGFLGLTAIAVLFVVYILKPQFKEKRVSSTMIWKRVVLHSKKKNLFFSNFLIFLIQALVIAIISAGLAEPRLFSNNTIVEDSEYVMILDSSASMRARSLEDGTTRFSRAVEAAKTEIDEFFSQAEDGTLSLIIADDEPNYLFSNLKKENKAEIFEMLSKLTCTQYESDIDSAMKLAGNRLESNPYAKIFLITDTQFGSLGTAVEVLNIADKTIEKNIAILGCTVGVQDNEFLFELVVGAYGDITQKCFVSVDIIGADNGMTKRDLHLDVPVTFTFDEKNSSLEQIKRVSVVATNAEFGGQEDWVFDSYDEVKFSIENLNDSISDDDSYYVYGGQRDRIKIEYWSKGANSFWQLGFNNLSGNMRDYRDISFHEVFQDQGEKADNSGFDYYIFEHSIPEEIVNSLPQDGIVLLIDPDESINRTDLGLSINKKINLGELMACTGAAEHSLLNYTDPSRIHITEYSQLTINEGSQFMPILFFNNDPLLLVKETPSSKIVVMPFSINMSDFYGDQFQIFLYNLINHFMPVTLSEYDFVLGETVNLNCKGETLKVSNNDTLKSFSEFPAEFSFDNVGTYTFTTKFGLIKDDEVRKAYVHLSTSESKLFAQSDYHITLNSREIIEESSQDIFIWLAVAALILLLIEWYLQFKYIL